MTRTVKRENVYKTEDCFKVVMRTLVLCKETTEKYPVDRKNGLESRRNRHSNYIYRKPPVVSSQTH